MSGHGDVSVRRLGIGDHYVEHGARDVLLAHLGLTVEQIVQACLEMAGRGKVVSWRQSGNE